MTDPNDGNEKSKKRKYFAYGDPDDDAEIDDPNVAPRTRKSHYLQWGEPNCDEESVPRMTLKGLLAVSRSPMQYACTFQSNGQGENLQPGLSESILDSSAESQGMPNHQTEDFQHHDPALSSVSTEIVSDIFSEHGSSEIDIDEYCLQLQETFSEVDEDDSADEGMALEDPQFIPQDDFVNESEPHEPDDLTDQGNHQQEELFYQREIPQEENTDSVTIPQNVIHTIPAYQSTLAQLMVSKFTQLIASNVCVSPREILLNILNLTEAHDVNNTLFVGICKLINSIFSDPILPDTVYKVDDFLLSSCGMRYHFYCSSCLKSLLNSKQVDFVTCLCGVVNNVSDLTKSTYFVSFDICTQLELILRDPDVACQLLDVKSYRRVDSGMRDLYDGEIFKKYVGSLNFNDGAFHLSFIFCFDGSPLYKSSDNEMWPLLGTLNELPPLSRMKKTFLIGLWFGAKKPDFKTFFKPIVRRVTNLSNTGATINIGGKETFVKIHCLGGCVDSAARGPIQGIHLHNGAFGCSWCLHPGELEGQGSTARKYQYLDDPPHLRTHHEIYEDAIELKKLPHRSVSAPKPHINGVIAFSPLLKLPHFDIVNGMVLDAMHNSFLGVARQLLRLWFGIEGNVKLPDGGLPLYYIGSPSNVAKINRRIALLIPPVEVRRLPRPISDLVHYKAHELENFLFYFLVPVLTGILPRRFLKHTVLYIQGMYLLMKDVVLNEDIATAEFLLDQFVKEVEKVYENTNFSQFKQYTYNVHLSLHAVDNARRWGSGWSVSGYAFESGIGVLKKVVHANRGIPSQVARALCKSNVRDLLSQEVKSARCASFLNQVTPQKSVSVTFINEIKVIGISGRDFHPDAEEEFLLQELALAAHSFSEAKKILHKNSLFAPRSKEIRTRNDFAVLDNEKIVQIKKIIVSETLNTVMIYCSTVHVEPFPLQYPPHLSVTSPFLFNIQLIEQERNLIPYNLLSKPCVYSNLKAEGGSETVSVMANVFNIF